MTLPAEAPRARIRPALTTDFEAVYPLLCLLNDTRLTREVWRRLFEPLWRDQDFCPGYLLEAEGKAVGFIGTLDSERVLHGVSHRIRNLTSWVVLPEYRSQSVMLLMPILRDKSVTLTSLTSSEEAYAVYSKLGFDDLDASARVIYRLPGLRARAYRVLIGQSCLAALDGSLQEIGEAHLGLDVEHCLVEGPGTGRCYLVIERKRGRAHVHFISDLPWFRAHAGKLRHALLSTLELRTMQVDERFLEGRRIAFSRTKVFDQPKQFRSQELAVDDIDALYSELVVLATKP